MSGTKEHRLSPVQKDILLRLNSGESICTKMGLGEDGWAWMTNRNPNLPSVSRNRVTNVTIEILLNNGYIEEEDLKRLWISSSKPSYGYSVRIHVYWRLSDKGRMKLSEERLI